MNVHTSETRFRFREAIGNEIDRLIAMLDELEGDVDLESYLADTEGRDGDREGDLDENEGERDEYLEDDGSDEPTLGSPEKSNGFFVFWRSERHPGMSQAYWSDGDGRAKADDREEENEHGGDIQDEPHDDGGSNSGTDYEPDLGWTNHVNQTLASKVHNLQHAEDGEPEFGFVGIGTGWREGEEVDDREGGDERDWDAGCPMGGDHGIADGDALCDPNLWLGQGADCDGSGNRLARKMLQQGGGIYRPETRSAPQRDPSQPSKEDLIPEFYPGSILRFPKGPQVLSN